MMRTLKLLAERALVLDMASEVEISLHIYLLCIATELSSYGWGFLWDCVKENWHTTEAISQRFLCITIDFKSLGGRFLWDCAQTNGTRQKLSFTTIYHALRWSSESQGGVSFGTDLCQAAILYNSFVCIAMELTRSGGMFLSVRAHIRSNKAFLSSYVMRLFTLAISSL
jgi:hypothetical protein